MATFEDIAELPLVAAAYYDKLLKTSPGLAQLMSREEYIRHYCRMIMGDPQMMLTTTGSSTRVEPVPTVEQTAAEVKAAVEAQK